VDKSIVSHVLAHSVVLKSELNSARIPGSSVWSIRQRQHDRPTDVFSGVPGVGTPLSALCAFGVNTPSRVRSCSPVGDRDNVKQSSFKTV